MVVTSNHHRAVPPSSTLAVRFNVGGETLLAKGGTFHAPLMGA